MGVPRVYPIRKLKKKLKQYGIIWVSHRGKGGHGIFQGQDTNGEIQSYPLPSAEHKKEVTGNYLRGLLRRFGLNENIFNE